MSNKIFLGIDTSNYTTSVAFCDIYGNVIKNYKLLLPVKKGERGLRQSEAVFSHIKNIPLISKNIVNDLKNYDFEILAIGHSGFPRDCEGSYMPCFLVGEAISDFLASIYKVKNYKFSHQNGHIRAALFSAELNDLKESFISFHVSGGTTEILYVSYGDTLNVSLIGGSKDLNAGQAIDRIGVRMGLDFPCGPQIEELAKRNNKNIPTHKISVERFDCNLSGLENLALNLYEKTNDKSLVSAFTLDYIAKVLSSLTQNLKDYYGDIKIVFAGGVMSNSIIKNTISSKFKNVFFASPEYSSDNAVGISFLTKEKYFKEEKDDKLQL